MTDAHRRLTAVLILTLALTAQVPLNATNTEASKPPARLAAAALARTHVPVTYDPSYQSLEYPGGDVDNDRGVCSDVVIRAYRAIGIDLQRRVHEDMRSAFEDYPDHWGLTRPDANIDHRRVPNLERFFERAGAALGPGNDVRTGDIVTWRLPSGAPHIGVVQSRRSDDGRRPLVVHNIGQGPVLDDVLEAYTRHGHFRYFDRVDSP